MRLTRARFYLGALAVLLCVAQTAQAVPVKYEFTAQVGVITLNDPNNIVPDFTAGLSTGDIISGSFSYDTDTPSLGVSGQTEDYAGTAQFPMRLTVNFPAAFPLMFEGINGSPFELQVNITNDSRPTIPTDIFQIRDPETNQESPGLLPFVDLNLNGMGVFSDTSLPFTLDLADWDTATLLVGMVERSATSANLGSRAVSATVLTLTQVPEPGTLALLAIGLLGLAWRRYLTGA